MRWLRRILLSIGVLAVVILALAAHYYYKGFYGRSAAPEEGELLRIRQVVAGEKSFLAHHQFNTGICFLADMSLPSGRNRFFVYDLGKDSVLMAGLVAHGCGSSNFSATPSFSNVNGSSCTALGRYRVGYPYAGQFGRAYKLYGLDTTNDQAFARNIVLHSYMAVPAHETYPYLICNSRGCPMVSPVFLQQLQPFIDRSKQPVMLCIFN